MKRRKLLNQTEAAQLLGVSVTRLAGWLDRGLIPFVRIGRVRKLDSDALMDWYQGQIVSPVSDVEYISDDRANDRGEGDNG